MLKSVMSSLAAAARGVIARPAPITAVPQPTIEQPDDLYTEADMPELDLIEAAAKAYDQAADSARRADRGKRAARKILDRLPIGTYGSWVVQRTPSSRQTADLQEIARIFKANGLGPVPMKSAAPSLKVVRAEVAQVLEQVAA